MASQSGSMPAVGVTSGVRASILLDDGLLADMAPYAAKTGFDFSVFFESLLDVPGNENGQIRSLPYVRSTPVFYYNKTMADAKGLKAPETVAELEAFAKALNTYDPATAMAAGALSCSTTPPTCRAPSCGSWVSPWLGEGGTAPCLEGSLLKLFTDWTRWIDEGWCRPFDSTGAQNTATEMFYQGKLACFVASCGSLSNIYKFSKEAGIELGVSYYPTYDIDNRAVSIGGGNIILMAGNSEEVTSAGWEFIQFLMSDDMVAAEAHRLRLSATTKTVENNEAMAKFWEENPLFKVAYDQLAWGHCEETPMFLDRTEFKTNVSNVTSQLIQERNITPEQAIEQIKSISAHLF